MRQTILISVVSILAAVSSFGQETPGVPGVVAPGVTPPSPAPLGEPTPTSPVVPRPPGNLRIVPDTDPAASQPLTNATPAPGAQQVPTNAVAGPTGPASGVLGSSITPVQLQNINRITAALNALALPGRDVTQRQRAVIDALQAAPLTVVRPAPEVIANLGANLVAIVPALRLTALQRRQLAIDLNLALNSANLTESGAERVLADARRVLRQGAGDNPDAIQILMEDLTTMINQVHAALAELQAPPAQRDPVQAVGSPPPTQSGQSGASQPVPQPGLPPTGPAPR